MRRVLKRFGFRENSAPGFILFALALALPIGAVAQEHHSIRVERGQFLYDGQPLQIISGEMHYPRIPRADWRDRFRKARAMGLNTITTYVFWNLHEPKLGEYHFAGQLDVAEFIREAQQEGLHVIARVGPYVCSEWDLGGLPPWLLADPKMVLRANDERFLQPARNWLTRLGWELAPLQVTRGGPIIAVQVENEYGSFGSDKNYMAQIRDIIAGAGFNGAILYTADGPSELPNGTLPDLPAVVNFGPGDAQQAFAALHTFRPDGPMMSGEYWDGWFDHWGEQHHITDAKQQAQDLEWILSHGYSVSLYMFEGGTSFGFMNGANFGRGYEPVVTSYDYDSPLDEAGRPTQKFYLFRDVIRHHLHGENLPSLPEPTPIIEIPRFTLQESASLWANLGPPIRVEHPETMEAIGQSYGYILYRARLKGPVQADLVINEVEDYAEIFLDGRRVGSLDRRAGQDRLALDVPPSGGTLDILVENSGRINFGPKLRDDRKGITQPVTLAGKELTGWEMYPLPMLDLSRLKFSAGAAESPAFYRGSFELKSVGDTFLDTRGLGKGAVWVNGHNLGRFWNMGPQQTLYLPGAWQRIGKNEVILFGLDAQAKPSLEGLREPILNESH